MDDLLRDGNAIAGLLQEVFVRRDDHDDAPPASPARQENPIGAHRHYPGAGTCAALPELRRPGGHDRLAARPARGERARRLERRKARLIRRAADGVRSPCVDGCGRRDHRRRPDRRAGLRHAGGRSGGHRRRADRAARPRGGHGRRSPPRWASGASSTGSSAEPASRARLPRARARLRERAPLRAGAGHGELRRASRPSGARERGRPCLDALHGAAAQGPVLGPLAARLLRRPRARDRAGRARPVAGPTWPAPASRR